MYRAFRNMRTGAIAFVPVDNKIELEKIEHDKDWEEYFELVE